MNRHNPLMNPDCEKEICQHVDAFQDETLQAVRKDYQVFTAIEQQLRDTAKTAYDSYKTEDDGSSVYRILDGGIESVLQVIQQHKADLFAKYNL